MPKQSRPYNRLSMPLLKQDNQDGLDTRALLVLQGGRLVAESYADEYDQHTAFLGWSMGKSLTAILLGTLEQQGKLDVNEQNLFNDWLQDERADIRIRDLLTMTSGLDFDETYAPGSDATRMLFTSPSASEVAMESALHKSPGHHFSYSSGTSNLLARLLFERVGGTAQANVDYFYQALLVPLGLSSTVFEPDASGVFVGSSYIYANARDWSKLGQLLLNDGVWNQQRLLPEGWVARATAPNSSDNDPRYGYQFWLNGGGDDLRWPNLPQDTFAMNGNRSQMVVVVPSRDMVIVRLGWTPFFYPVDENLSYILNQSSRLLARHGAE